jgi:hypothetical protein
MNRARVKRRSIKPKHDPATERLIRLLVAACDDPAAALEVYYWSKEPGLREIMRGIAVMPDEARAAIEAFVALARDAKSVTADLDGRGALILASVEAAKTVAQAQLAVAEETDEAPRLLH